MLNWALNTHCVGMALCYYHLTEIKTVLLTTVGVTLYN